MAATQNIESPERAGNVLSLPVAASTRIYAGTLVARNATGYAVPASNAAGLRVIGRAEREVDNSSGAAGAAAIDIKRGTFRFANSASAAIAVAHIGNDCWADDDETVRATANSNKVIAGKIVALEGDSNKWVWVDTVPALYALVSSAT